MNFIEPIFIISLFLIYFGMWKIREIKLKKRTGINPEVFSSSTTGIQKFMNKLTAILTVYAVIIIAIHTTGFQYASLFSRFGALDSMAVDIAGFIIGISGLSICLYAQIKMGRSWRVGIDEKSKTELITTGLYRLIRNPTYLGLFILNAGLWLIWPTWTVFIFNLVFILFLEIQVRCEEDFLLMEHGDVYENYKRKTKRYLPFIY